MDPDEIPQHLLVIEPPCDSPAALDAFLRCLPLRQKCDGEKQYLLLALTHGTRVDAAMPWANLNKEARSFKEVMVEVSTITSGEPSLKDCQWSWVGCSSGSIDRSKHS